MKKHLLSLFLVCSLYMCACKSDKVSKISKGAKVIGRCCAELAADSPGKAIKGKAKTPENAHEVSSVLPAYFWDTKSMNW